MILQEARPSFAQKGGAVTDTGVSVLNAENVADF